MSNSIVTAAIRTKGINKTRPLYQYDYGITLQLIGAELPQSYEVHFSNTQKGNATTQIGDENGVAIPDTYLTTGSDVYAWLYLHDGTTDGETIREILIPVIPRAKPTDQPPTPVQQSVIEEAIAALNSAVQKTGQDVTDADRSASEAAQSARDALASERNAAASAQEAYDIVVAAGNIHFSIDENGHIWYIAGDEESEA